MNFTDSRVACDDETFKFVGNRCCFLYSKICSSPSGGW